MLSVAKMAALLLVAAVLCSVVVGSQASQSIFSFGSNRRGQIGDGTLWYRPMPVSSSVFAGHTITAVAAGNEFTLALSDTGNVFSVGLNSFGQLGDGTRLNCASLVAVNASGVLNGSIIVAIAAGDSHSLILSDTGKVYSFGRNSEGQLGDGTWSERTLPVAVNDIGALLGHNITAIAAGDYHSLVLSSTGKVFTFGRNNKGELGQGTKEDSNVPGMIYIYAQLVGLNFTAIACGSDHSLILSSDGQVFAFGDNNNGQLGDGNPGTESNVPVAITSNSVLSGHNITGIAAGSSFSLLKSEDGKVFSFGENNQGQLGDGTNKQRDTAVAVLTSGVLNGTNITFISAGDQHSLVISGDGAVFSFGRNHYGQLGDGTVSPRYSPVAVNTSGLLNGVKVVAADAGNTHSVLLSDTGVMFAFGFYSWGQLGDGANTFRTVPTAVSTDDVLSDVEVVAIAAGESHSIALTDAGQIVTFGRNSDGQLGDGTYTDRVSPVKVDTTGVLNNTVVKIISGGRRFSLAASEEGHGFSFGNNQDGQLGDNTTTSRPRAVEMVTAGSIDDVAIVALSAGDSHSLILTATGYVFAVGANNRGQLGDGTNSDSETPVEIFPSVGINGTNLTAIAAGGSHSLVLTQLGKVFSFGYNTHGQLGDGTTTDRDIAVAVFSTGVLNGTVVTAIAAGRYFSLVLSENGRVFSFGLNDAGQLGDGTTSNKYVPVAVSTLGVLNETVVIAISAGTRHSLVLSASGQVYSFGSNSFGQLGTGSTTDSNIPVAVSLTGLLNNHHAIAIAAGTEHSLILTIPDDTDPSNMNSAPAVVSKAAYCLLVVLAAVLLVL